MLFALLGIKAECYDLFPEGDYTHLDLNRVSNLRLYLGEGVLEDTLKLSIAFLIVFVASP